MEQVITEENKLRPTSTNDNEQPVNQQQYATIAEVDKGLETVVGCMDQQLDKSESKMLATPQLNKNLLASQQKKYNTIILSFRSQDKWLKRAAEAKGWVINSGNTSLMFNVKWEFSESNKDIYKTLRNNQFYNHFPDTRELTTKQGLNTNL